jgi:PAS domain S-box-containing protein
LLFVRPEADWSTMLVRDSGTVLLTTMVGILVIRTVSQLRSRTILLDREIAMRQRADSDLQASRVRFEQFLDAAPFCAYLKDADGRFLFMNRHLRTVYPEVVAGQTVHESFTSEQAEDFTRNDDWVRRTGEPVTCEESALGTDGIERHWSSFKFPVTDGEGRRGVGGVSIEITDRKRADAQATRSESLLRRLIEVQEQEKRSLCHEFHDGLMQYAIGARMLLDAWRHEHPDAEADAVDEAMRTIDAGIADGRRTIRGIRPETLDDLGLKAAVEEYAASLAGPGLDVAVEVAADVDAVPPTVQTTAFRIVQEACANARRHSGTDRFEVDLRLDGDALAIRVEDFGHGFDTASPPKPGFGVVGMTERARLAGGECRLESVPGRGTVVTARLATHGS